MRIVDGHAHVASMQFVPKAFVTGVAENIAAPGARNCIGVTAAQVQRLLEAQHQDHHADQLVREMDEAGIAMTVLLVPDFSGALEVAMPIQEMALRHRDIQLRHPGRFYVFQGVDPRSGTAAVDFFERTIVEYNFNGLKLYPPCGYSPSDASLFPFYEVCSAYGLPVLLHTGPTSPVLDFGPAHPSLVDQAAKTFPKVNFILAHGGVNHVADASLMCAYRPNVYMDIAGFTSALHPQGWKHQLHELFRTGINHKIIFGTDWPLTRMSGSMKDLMAELLGPQGPLAGLSRPETELILAGTIERLIGNAGARSQLARQQRSA